MYLKVELMLEIGSCSLLRFITSIRFEEMTKDFVIACAYNNSIFLDLQ
jgi:hypothetical protein